MALRPFTDAGVLRFLLLVYVPGSARRLPVRQREEHKPEGGGDDEETTIELLMKWLAFSLSVFVVARLTDSVHIRTVGTALAVAAVYGVLKVLPGV